MARKMGWVSASLILDHTFCISWCDRYKTLDSTWNNEALLPNSQRHIEEFEEEAKRQGLDVSNPDARVLLWEAVEIGEANFR